MMRAMTKRNSDEGGGRVTATMVKKRAMARAMVMRVVGDKEGDGDGGNMARNKDDGLVPVVVQQPVLYLSSVSLGDVGDEKGDRTRTVVGAPHK